MFRRLSIRSFTPLWTQWMRWNNWLLLSRWNSIKLRLMTVSMWFKIDSYRWSSKLTVISCSFGLVKGANLLRSVGTSCKHFFKCNAWLMRISAARILSSCGIINANLCKRSTLLKLRSTFVRMGLSSVNSGWLSSAIQSWMLVMLGISHIGSRIRARNVRLPSDVTQWSRTSNSDGKWLFTVFGFDWGNSSSLYDVSMSGNQIVKYFDFFL